MDSGAVAPGGMSPAADSGNLHQRLSFDVQSVDGLRRTARQSPQEGLRQAARQFEVLFMGMMLKSMRDATPQEGLFASQQEKTYTAMLDQQLAQHLSGRGLGLAEAMFAQLSKTLGTAEGGAPALPGAGVGVGVGRSAGGADPAQVVPAQAEPPRPRAATRMPTLAPLRPAPDLSIYEATAAQASYSRSVLPQAHVEQFVSRLMPSVQRASQASGVPAQLIMAQAALESGWGRREIRDESGQPTHNLFGIKADRSWKGPVAEVVTTEFVDGVARKTRAGFRAYASYDEAIADYASFITRNPRYSAVRQAPDAEQAAMGLQRAGYATDPVYGAKLIRIMRQL